jgi:hypothetical protein
LYLLASDPGGNGRGEPGTNGVPSKLYKGGGSGTTHELQTDPSGFIGSVGPLIPVNDSTGPLGGGALTPGIIGKSIPGIFVGLPSLSVSALTGVNTLAKTNSESKPLNNTLFILNILNYTGLVSNTLNSDFRALSEAFGM